MKILLTTSVLALIFWGCLGAQEDAEARLKRREAEEKQLLERENRLNLELYDALRRGLLNADSEVRLRSLSGIMAMEGVPDKERVIRDYLDDRDPQIRLAILDFYGQRTFPEDLLTLQLLLEDENIKVRHKLVDVFLAYHHNDINVYDPLKLMLEDIQISVRRRILEGLAQTNIEAADPQRLFGTLRDSLHDKVQDLRLQALDLVARLPLALIYDSLEAGLQDPQVKFRRRSLEIATQFNEPRTTRLILERLHDGLPTLRARAIEILAERMDENVARVFDNHMQDEADPDLRRRLIEAVAPLRNQTAVNLLTRAMDDPVAEVRQRAAELLREMEETIELDPLHLRR